MSEQVNLDYLLDKFEGLKVVGEVKSKARILNEKLIDIVKKRIISDTMIFSEFFCIAVGLRFTSELIHEQYLVPSINIHERRQQVMFVRDTMADDVDNVIRRLQNYWVSCYPALVDLIENKALSKNEKASKWLDLIMQEHNTFLVKRSYLRYIVTNDTSPVTIEENCGGGSLDLITDNLEKLIRYHEYGLSDELELKAIQALPLTYSVGELAERWGENEKNIIAVCNKQSMLWAYINLSKELRLEYFENKLISLETRNKLLSGKLDSEYKYPYCGFARIAKQAPVHGGITLEYFYSNKTIDVQRGELTFLWIEPPLCNRILGIYSQHIEANKSFCPTLYFMQDEIHRFEKTSNFKSLFSNNKINLPRNSRKSRRSKAARNNGKKSGIERKKIADSEWNRSKPAILELAIGEKDKSANYIAKLAVKKKLTSKNQSTIGKYIRRDLDFDDYIKRGRSY